MDDSRQQYIVLAELCNECGNCMTFCPENGDPAVVKPRLFTSPELFAQRTGQGFLVTADGVTSRQTNDDSLDLVSRLLASTKGNPLHP